MTAEDRMPLRAGEEETEAVNEFSYLGSQVESSGRIRLDVEKQVAQASNTLRNQSRTIINKINVTTKHKVY